MKYPNIVVSTICINCILWNLDLSKIICIAIRSMLKITVIVPNDNGHAKLRTLGIQDIGVVPKSDFTESATPNDIMNNPITKIV